MPFFHFTIEFFYSSVSIFSLACIVADNFPIGLCKLMSIIRLKVFVLRVKQINRQRRLSEMNSNVYFSSSPASASQRLWQVQFFSLFRLSRSKLQIELKSDVTKKKPHKKLHESYHKLRRCIESQGR